MPRNGHVMDDTRCHGFTLIELMTVLAVAAILAMLGAPSMGKLLARTREAGAEVALAGSLRHARAVAVMHNARVLACPSRDGRHCNYGEDWQHGWLVADDNDDDLQPDPGTGVWTVVGALPDGIRIVSSVGRGQLRFQPDGSAGGSNVWFVICGRQRHAGKAVIVANSGRVRTTDAEPARLQQCLAGMQ